MNVADNHKEPLTNWSSHHCDVKEPTQYALFRAICSFFCVISQVFVPLRVIEQGLHERVPALTRVVAAAALIAGLVVTPATAAAVTVATFDVDLVDTSVEGEGKAISPAQRERLMRVSERLREKLAAQTWIDLVPKGKVDTLLAAKDPGQYLHQCNGCDTDLGKELGADWVLVAWVQKVSNLILNLNVLVRDTHSEAMVATAFVDMRGNTVKSWLRSTDYLFDNVLLEKITAKR